MNGKGSKPRHKHDATYRENFDYIEWKRGRKKIKRDQLREDVMSEEKIDDLEK